MHLCICPLSLSLCILLHLLTSVRWCSPTQTLSHTFSHQRARVLYTIYYTLLLKTRPHITLSLSLSFFHQSSYCPMLISKDTHTLPLAYVHTFPLAQLQLLFVILIFTLSFYLSIICLSSYLSIYLPTYLSIYLPIFLSIYIPIFLSIYIPIYLSTYLSFYLSTYLSFYLSTYRSFYLPTYISFYLSTYLSFYLPTYISFYLIISLSIFTRVLSPLSLPTHFLHTFVRVSPVTWQKHFIACPLALSY